MVFGPQVVDPAAVNEAVTLARDIVGIDVPGLLPLRCVEALGGRLGYGYDVPDAASLVALTEQRRSVPPTAAAGILSAIAQTACDLGPLALHHPGPTKRDVLVERSGRVWLAGLAGPRRPDDGHQDEASLVEQLGRLLAELLTGRALPIRRTAGGQQASLRSTFELLASRGWRLEDAYRRLLWSGLAWEPSQRPSLAEVVETTRALAVAPYGESVAEWVRHTWRLVGARKPEPSPEAHFDPFVSDPDAVDRPTEPDGDEARLPADDGEDDTALSEHPAPPMPRIEQGSIPVGVGPPAEAVRKRRVPDDLFGRGITNELHRRRPAPLPFPRTLVVTAIVLGVTAVALATALVFGPS